MYSVKSVTAPAVPAPPALEKDVGIDKALYTTFPFISFLPCLHTFWHAIPTSLYIFNVLYSLYIGSILCRMGGAIHKMDPYT